MSRNRRNLRSEIWRESLTEEVTEELSFHVEMRAREIAAKKGVDIENARRIAAARFGDIAAVQADCMDIGRRRDRDMKRSTFWAELSQDARFALRQIRMAPAFSLLVIGTLALGIGSTTTIFSAINAVILRPLAFVDPHRVVVLSETYKGDPSDVSAGNFVDWKEQATLFDAVAAIDWDNYVLSAGGGAAGAMGASGTSPDQVLGAAVTLDYFRVYDVQPALGRAFTAEDAMPGAPRTVVLSFTAWSGRFNADRAIVGTDIEIDGALSRVIGVMPKGFDPMLTGEKLWVPLSFTADQIAARSSHYLDVVGRISARASASSVHQQLDRIARVQIARFPNDNQERSIGMRPLGDIVVGGYTGLLMLLLGAVSLVLLIACANVANMLIARGAARQKELVVRRALGAGRGRIMRQLLTENLVLALITVGVSLLLALAGVRLIVAFAPADIPRIAETRLDPVVFGFALLVGVLSSLLFGLAPALRAVRVDLQATLRSGGRDARGAVRDWLRSGLVAAEVGLSVLLLIGAGLLIRAGIRTGQVDPGFRTEGVVAARVTLPAHSYADPQRIPATFQAIVDRIAATPGVQNAAAASLPPLSAGGNEMFLNPDGRPLTNDNAVVARLRIVTSHYLDAMGIALTRGRAFGTQDVRNGVLVAVISEDLAQKLWPGEDPIGKRFACCEGDRDHPSFKTVVGVARTLRSRGPAYAPDPEFYLPISQAPPDAWTWLQRSMTLVATGTQSDQVVGAIRAAVRDVDPNVPVYDVGTVTDAISAVMAPARFNTGLLSLLGLFGLVLATTGIYGVVSYFVSLRRTEIGVRMALGASAGAVVRLLTRQALGPVAIGLSAGTAAALALTRVLGASLTDIKATDPVTFATVIAGLLAVSLLAILVPASRASRVSPTSALEG